MKTQSVCRLALPLALLSTTGLASAATTFQYSSDTLVNGQNISITSPNNVQGLAGEQVLTGSGPNAGQTILAWCLDIYDFDQSSGTYQVSSLTTAGSGGSNPTLTTTQIGEIGALMLHGEALINTSVNVSAAIQLAIWEVEYGSSFHSNGISSAVSTLASTYMTDVTGGTWAPDSNVGLLTDRGVQSLGFLTPLPATWTMMLLGLVGFGFVLYRRDSKKSEWAICG